MARYFFHVREGDRTDVDEDGLECSSLDAAERQASIMLGSVLANRPTDPHRVVSVDVADTSGAIMSRTVLTLETTR